MQIKYKKPDKPEKGVDYYARWLSQMIKDGYTLAKADLLAVLQCSGGFIQTLQQSVDYMHVSLDYFRDHDAPEICHALHIFPDTLKTQQTVLIYYQQDQIHDFLLTAEFSRQTRHVPINTAFRNNKDLINGWLEYKATDAQLHDQLRELYQRAKQIPDVIARKALIDSQEDAIQKPIIENETEQELFCMRACKEHARACNFKCRTGDDVKAVEVAPFEWWKCKGFYAARKSPYSCGELMYRAVFSSGWIKICFGNRKTFFCPPPDRPEGDTLLVTACAFPD